MWSPAATSSSLLSERFSIAGAAVIAGMEVSS